MSLDRIKALAETEKAMKQMLNNIKEDSHLDYVANYSKCRSNIIEYLNEVADTLNGTHLEIFLSDVMPGNFYEHIAFDFNSRDSKVRMSFVYSTNSPHYIDIDRAFGKDLSRDNECFVKHWDNIKQQLETTIEQRLEEMASDHYSKMIEYKTDYEQMANAAERG